MDAYDKSRELFGEGHYPEAMPFAKEALRLSESEFDLDHSNTAIAVFPGKALSCL